MSSSSWSGGGDPLFNGEMNNGLVPEGFDTGSYSAGGSLENNIMKIVENVGLGDLARNTGFMGKEGIPELKAYDSANPAVAMPQVTTPSLPVSTRSRTRKRTVPKSSTSQGAAKKRKVTATAAASKASAAGGKGKGLRHFSQKVCEKVESKGKTTYNEVADELVHDLNESGEIGKVDSKNIRRRVYDALNVLMAMKIIEKEKKVIRWKGLPTTDSAREIEALTLDIEQRRLRIKQKREHLATLQKQEMMYKNLTIRNLTVPLDSSAERVQLPFIVIHSRKDTSIECEMSEDRTEYFFDFSSPFEIHDDVEILRRLGFGEGSEVPVEASIVEKKLED